MLFFDMQDASEIPPIAEPVFAALRSQDPEFSDDEIDQLLRDIEQQSAPPAPEPRVKRPQAYSAASVRCELTVNELLQKIQRDIRNG